jgi:hypothetical protein
VKLNGTHQLLVYADDVNLLGESTDPTREIREALLVTGTEIGLGVNEENINYMFTSCEQNADQIHKPKTGNKPLESLAKFKHLETNLTKQNCIYEEIKARLNKWNTCHHSALNLLPSHLLSKDVKIKIYRPIILHVVLYGCKTWSLTFREELKLRVFENTLQWRIYGHKRNVITGEWRRRHNDELHDLYSSTNIV